MFEQIAFYIRHSLNDMLVNRQRTFFALMAIAAGVAAIVSLQTLAVLIDDTLTGNLRENNRGDISFTVGEAARNTDSGLRSGVLGSTTTQILGSEQTVYQISSAGIEQISRWIDDNYGEQIEMTYRVAITDFIGFMFGGGVGTAMTPTGSDDEVRQISPILIESSKYPFYSEIITEDGLTLAEAMREPTDIILGDDLARDLSLEVGDTVNVSGTDTLFTVVGVVPTASEIRGGADFFIGLFGGFYYLDTQALEFFDAVEFGVSDVYFKIDESVSLSDVEREFDRAFPYFSLTTTEDIREQNQQLSDNINQLVTIMGLLSLLIGSIGIVNTMQVVVRRRMVEVAVLKTIGLQAYQITILFLSEAFIMGVMGSLAGIVLGWGATYIIKGAAEAAFSQELNFRLAIGPVVNGFVVGVLVTTVFGFLPTLSAGDIRPSVVLRPNDSVFPKSGRIRSLLVFILIIGVLSLIAQTILGSLAISVAVVAGAFLAAGILYSILSLLIWVIGQFFPSLGIVDLKLSLRQMIVTRARGASTLLALVVGVFTLSLITLFADSISSMLAVSLESSGGNVLIAMSSPGQLPPVEDILLNSEEVNSFMVASGYNTQLVSMQDRETGEVYSESELNRRLQESNLDFPPFLDGTQEDKLQIQRQILSASFEMLEGRSLTETEGSGIIDGRDLQASDSGKQVIVLSENEVLKAIDISVGDTVLLKLEGIADPIAYEIVGLKSEMMSMNFSGASSYVPEDSFPTGVEPSTVSVIADVNEDDIRTVRQRLERLPGIFVLPTAFFTELIDGLLGTFIAFPTMVALLGLIVGGVVIANSVALTTMERRQEIAVMKAMGLQRERVLGMLLLENGILGIVGGLIGVGIGLVGLIIMVSQMGTSSEAVPYFSAFLLMGLCVVVALVAALASAWGASGEKPLTVLRYE